MKLIIDIPDNIYDAIKKAQTIISGQRSGKPYCKYLSIVWKTALHLIL